VPSLYSPTIASLSLILSAMLLVSPVPTVDTRLTPCDDWDATDARDLRLERPEGRRSLRRALMPGKERDKALRSS
jgi:hypothetical protein